MLPDRGAPVVAVALATRMAVLAEMGIMRGLVERGHRRCSAVVADLVAHLLLRTHPRQEVRRVDTAAEAAVAAQVMARLRRPSRVAQGPSVRLV
ncbi:hypothetical protein WK78_28790 [Burkholderia cepacia]|nr:hypothetical protein WK78_28790 [Burkholderia cepacia]